MPPKPKLLDVWDPSFFEIMERTLDGTPTKAKCRCVSCVAMYVLILIVHRLCSEWQQVANATRMAQHLKTHRNSGLMETTDDDRDDENDEPPMKIRGIEEHFPKMLTPTQKSLVDRKLTLAALQNGWSYSSLQRPSVGRFLMALRPG